MENETLQDSSTTNIAGKNGAASISGDQEMPASISKYPDYYEISMDPDLYDFINLIGESNGVPVYEAHHIASALLYEDPHLVTTSFAILVVDKANQEQYDRLSEEIWRNIECKHKNILRILGYFPSNGCLYVVLSYKEVDSLRNLMASSPVFKNGLPENCIAIALRETLYGLGGVHEIQEVHKKISGANVVFDKKSGSIKLAYAASVYEPISSTSGDNDDQKASSSSWDLGLNLIDVDDHDEKCDIWLIGIAALELAYGSSFKFVCCEQLEDLVEGIVMKRRLPTRGEVMFFVKGSDVEKKEGKKVMNSEGNMEERSFSRSFGRMVADCLAKDPMKRPNVMRLLQHEFFKDSKSAKYFEDVVVKRSVDPVWQLDD